METRFFACWINGAVTPCSGPARHLASGAIVVAVTGCPRETPMQETARLLRLTAVHFAGSETPTVAHDRLKPGRIVMADA